MCALGLTEVPIADGPRLKDALDEVVAQIGHIILGKETTVQLAIACLLARGHLLIEDVPGVGKTTLAHTLAKSLGLQFSRIQFTSDMLPADILGVSIYERTKAEFQFHPGPIFSEVVLADEINRATPKAQSALLEAMAENQVTQDGETRTLPDPFFVIATQNPANQMGTFPLPESQLDRFLMRVRMGYPDAKAERALLNGADRKKLVATLQPCLSTNELLHAQTEVDNVLVSDALLDYLQALIRQTRESDDFELGLSPRAGLALLRATRAWALMAGRNYALPEDLQTVLPSVVGHRLRRSNQQNTGDNVSSTDYLLSRVSIP